MASPSLNAQHSGVQAPSSTASSRITVPVAGTPVASRPASAARSTGSDSDLRASQPAAPSPSWPQANAPVNDKQSEKPKGEPTTAIGTDNYAQLASLIKASKPEIVRQVVRDHWQRCLIGSDFHIGFILNTTLHHASEHLLGQAVQDFGSKLASATKDKWVTHLSTPDLDEIADGILSRASDKFLDRALARRFETISGRALVNALARAERLGYDTRDIVGEKEMDLPERVIPSMHPSTPSGYAPNGPSMGHQQQQSYPPQYQHPQPQPQYRAPQPPAPPSHPIHFPTAAEKEAAKPLGMMFCDACGRPCSGPYALDNHIKKRACANHVTKMDRLGSDTCLHCGVTFTSNGGLAYHNKSKVCGTYTDIVNEKMMQLLQERASIPAPKYNRTSQQSAPQPSSTAYQTPTQPVQSRTADYSQLSPQQQSQFDTEMKQAEEFYGGQMRNAMLLDAEQREEEFAKIKNRLNSRQSNLRKKYGIKLRDRRTRAQIDADNARIAGASPAGPSPAGSSPSGTPPPTSQQRPASSVKRPLSVTAESPRKRVPLSEMSGLKGAAASAETTDPTLNMTPSQPRPPVQAPPVSVASTAGTHNAEPMVIDDSADDAQQPGKAAKSGDGASMASQAGSGIVRSANAGS